MMASLLGKPLIIHEQNSIAGLANRVLSAIADRLLCGFPNALGGKSVWLGNPVRQAICAVEAPGKRWAGRSGPLSLLVVGGSLGASALNDVVPRALALLPPEQRPRVRHQAGEKQLANLQKNYERATLTAECVPFIADMASAYGEADVVVCRSGALTVAELAAAGCASVLVPFPYAVDDHQTANAKFLSDHGAAVLLPQDEMTPEALATLLGHFRRDTLLGMAEKARGLARPDAARDVAHVCKELAR
jgi:UDP-N-acetylglucosamine--N-acetylmuramyl-(pentapeptide) pyrophosphoryl-undecaprenol N-acetylglucosamine transferase